MLVTVTPNAAIDHTSFVVQFRPAQRNLAVAEHRQAGGKGVNVARIARSLGADAQAIVVVGGLAGLEIGRDLESSGLRPAVVQGQGESRTCIEIIDETSGTATQVHGAGVNGDEDTAHALVATVRRCLAGASWLALCGSLPRGMPTDLYARLVRVGREHGTRVAVDASGDALVAAVLERPDVVRINREEAVALRGELGCGEVAPDAAPGLYVVSDGPREIIARTADRRGWRICPPPIELRNPIGCGDAMLAALLTTIDSLDLGQALRFVTALASASAETRFVGGIDLVRAGALLAQTRLREIA